MVMRSDVRRLLAKYDYPPDPEGISVKLVVEKADVHATVVTPADASS